MSSRLAFCVIAWAYVGLVALYAVKTPFWQIPDEPAHYNYVRFVAEQGALPVLNFGDYDQAYLDAIKAQKFPPGMSIDAIRYESHQPPLYYVMLAPFYLAGEGASLGARLIGLRLASALLGVVLLALVFRISSDLFPTDTMIPIVATAFVAFVPQHLAMLAGVENDALADVLLAAAALSLLRVLRRAQGSAAGERQAWWAVGLFVGLGFITKTTTYVSVGLVAVTLLLLVWHGDGVRRSLRWALPALVLALGIGAMWFVRDAFTYGPLDWLGLARHDAVVVGQPRTLDLYGSYWNAATDYFPIMFRSFWGQFGWMGVPLDNRTYKILFALSAFILVGCVLFIGRLVRRTLIPANTLLGAQVTLLSAWFLFTFVATVGYSLDFFQAQGRYLFPALPAIAIAFAVGLWEWLQLVAAMLRRLSLPRVGIEWPLATACVVGLAAFAFFCLERFLIPGLSGL